MGDPAFGQVIKKEVIAADFISGPGEILVPRLIMAMAQIPQMQSLFGPVLDSQGQFGLRWADYSRYDWSLRQLPAINVYESGAENKEAEQGYMTGSVTLQIFWPANFRRSDLARIPRTFSAAITNFFASQYAIQLLDPHPTVNVSTKVPGLNELGKNITWSPNVEGLVESELVPVTMVEVRYRVDLRAWYRFLDTDNRTKENPFARTLVDLAQVFGVYNGIQESPDNVQVEIPQHITL
jgi:hypothetical protein